MKKKRNGMNFPIQSEVNRTPQHPSEEDFLGGPRDTGLGDAKSSFNFIRQELQNKNEPSNSRNYSILVSLNPPSITAR